MTIQEMKERKIEKGYCNADVARLSGVPLSTVSKIFSGETKAPHRDTLLAMESVLTASSQEEKKTFTYDTTPKKYGYLAEPPAAYQINDGLTAKRPGEYTLEDYLALPDDQRVELIDGVFYNMEAPLISHQFICLQIGHQFMDYIEKNGGPCKPVLSPVDVQLDKDDKTVVQPDVLILCRPEILIKNGRVFGAPDFVAEILSPSTKKKDMTLKLSKYACAGVREYWIIDPDKKQILVYDLENEDMPKLYNFQSEVPVLIWDGRFSVDFKAVYEYIKDYLDK